MLAACLCVEYKPKNRSFGYFIAKKTSYFSLSSSYSFWQLNSQAFGVRFCLKMRVKMYFSKITKDQFTDSETFLRLCQTIYERIKDCHEEGLNAREVAHQPRILTTKPTILDRRIELFYLNIWWLFKIGLREWNFLVQTNFFPESWFQKSMLKWIWE